MTRVPARTTSHTWAIAPTSRGTLIRATDQRTVGNMEPTTKYPFAAPNYQVTVNVTSVSINSVGGP